jgi:hypothetical protein
MAGLRGINLSGGQRQRLNVARAAYAASADVRALAIALILCPPSWLSLAKPHAPATCSSPPLLSYPCCPQMVLLDNALSAVDHHTAQHIFSRCVRGLMADKAVVLITHQVEFLPQCDKVAIMDDGNMIYFGPWNADAHAQLSKVLPTSHLLAAAGAAEQPREVVTQAGKKKLTHSCSVPSQVSSCSFSTTRIPHSHLSHTHQPAAPPPLPTQEFEKKKAARRTQLTLMQALVYYVAKSPAYGFVFLMTFILFLAAQVGGGSWQGCGSWWCDVCMEAPCTSSP